MSGRRQCCVCIVRYRWYSRLPTDNHIQCRLSMRWSLVRKPALVAPKPKFTIIRPALCDAHILYTSFSNNALYCLYCRYRVTGTHRSLCCFYVCERSRVIYTGTHRNARRIISRGGGGCPNYWGHYIPWGLNPHISLLWLNINRCTLCAIMWI